MYENGRIRKLRVFFILKIFKIFLGIYENGRIRNLRLISKFMTSQPGKQTITIHMLPNISRIEDNQTMKCGQLIGYNVRNIFCEKYFSLNITQKMRQGD